MVGTAPTPGPNLVPLVEIGRPPSALTQQLSKRMLHLVLELSSKRIEGCRASLTKQEPLVRHANDKLTRSTSIGHEKSKCQNRTARGILRIEAKSNVWFKPKRIGKVSHDTSPIAFSPWIGAQVASPQSPILRPSKSILTKTIFQC